MNNKKYIKILSLMFVGFYIAGCNSVGSSSSENASYLDTSSTKIAPHNHSIPQTQQSNIHFLNTGLCLTMF